MAESLETGTGTATSLDLKGLACPLPVVKLAQRIKTVPVSAVVECEATDPGVLADIPAWCRTTGHELVEMNRQDKVIRFLVRRTK